MAHVLFIDLERAWRGGQEQALLLITGLQRLGHSAEIVAVQDSAIALRAHTAGIPVHAVGARARRISAALCLRRLIRKRSFDLVYANEAHALTAAWLARSHRHVPLVAARRVAFPLSRNLISLGRYRRATRILAISEAARREVLGAGLVAKRVEIVPDGVEIPDPATPEKREKARQSWGFLPQETVLLSVGALTAEKGHALLIQSFAILRKQIANSRLLIAGDGPLRARLERQARDAGLGTAIVFAGFIEDVNAAYAAADLFVFPSLQEGAGSSLLRAMAYGLPVVALARGGVAEIVQNGQNGILVEDARAEDFAVAAARLLRDREIRLQLSGAGRETVQLKYSAKRMIDTTARIFEQVIAEAEIR